MRGGRVTIETPNLRFSRSATTCTWFSPCAQSSCSPVSDWRSTRIDGASPLPLQPARGGVHRGPGRRPGQLLAGLRLAFDADRRLLLLEAVERRSQLVE